MIDCVVVTATQNGHQGRGEGIPIFYRNENVESLAAQIESIRPFITSVDDRLSLATLLPANGARCAVDAALWDLQAKIKGKSVTSLAGLPDLQPIETVDTIYLDTPEKMAARAAEMSDLPIIKLKLGATEDEHRVQAVHDSLPSTRLIIDANAGWSLSTLEKMLPILEAARVEMVEQPLPPGQDQALSKIESPIPLCADESFQTADDLPFCTSHYQAVNVKLDKCGGLTSALAIGQMARQMGLKLMVGNMIGSSLGMAPAFVFAQSCDWCDLDGPLSLAADEEPALTFKKGNVAPPSTALWG
ncbi:MAG: dipeptide epimerase [Pseudomonadota bacterium]